MNILVLCTGNSARSILLESLLNTQGQNRLRAWSAGSHPSGRVHPKSLELLQTKGHRTGGLRSKSWDEFAQPGAPVMDAVITVCGDAANEVCPIWPGTPVKAHWGVDDPAKAPPDQQDAAFAQAYARLETRAKAFLALPLESLTPAELQQALIPIGNL